MIIYEKKLVETEVVKDVICNKCGKSCKTEWEFESATLIGSWGYGSKKDGVLNEAEICEACFDEFVNSFAIKVVDIGRTI